VDYPEYYEDLPPEENTNAQPQALAESTDGAAAGDAQAENNDGAGAVAVPAENTDGGDTAAVQAENTDGADAAAVPVPAENTDGAEADANKAEEVPPNESSLSDPTQEQDPGVNNNNLLNLKLGLSLGGKGKGAEDTMNNNEEPIVDDGATGQENTVVDE